MKVAYISSIAFADLDLSLIQSLSSNVDVAYYMLVGLNKKSTAIDLSDVDLSDGITCASSVNKLRVFSKFINLSNTYIVYSSSSKGYSLANLRKGWDLYHHLKHNEYDIIHLTTAPPYTYWMLYAFRKRMVLTVHDPIPHSSDQRYFTELWRKVAFRGIRNLILLNQSQREPFLKRYKLKENKKRLLVSSLGPYSYLQLFADGGLSKSNEYILYFGNVLSYKGLDYLFPAMVELHQRMPNINLIAAGSGNYYFDIKPYEQLSYFDIRNRYIPDDELALLIQNCKFVVVPYIDATQSGVVMSAFAFCKPCIVTNVGGLPEMVQNKRHGVVVPPCDTRALSESMFALLNDSKVLQEYELNIAEDYFKGDKSWDKIAENISKFYSNII